MAVLFFSLLLFGLPLLIVLFRKNPRFEGSDVDGEVLLVIAHPDDETMFFGPTLKALVLQGLRVRVLCLSSGNAEGLGEIRKNELVSACAILGIASKYVAVISHTGLQDGMGVYWDKKLVARVVKKYVSETAINVESIVTFDKYGVSGHPNHISCAIGCELLSQDFDVWQLQSSSLLRKYIGVLDVVFSLLFEDSEMQVFTNSNYRTIWCGMKAHASQFVWYRRLFIVFSSFSVVNTLKHLKVKK